MFSLLAARVCPEVTPGRAVAAILGPAGELMCRPNLTIILVQ